MTTSSIDDPAALKALAVEVRALLHGNRPDDAAVLLLAALDGRPSDVARQARDLRPEHIRAPLPDFDRVALRQTPATTGIGIDLSIYGGRDGPAAYCNFYSDGRDFAFEGVALTTLAAACREYGPPWQGGFDHVEAHDIVGMDALYFAARALDEKDPDRVLAMWMMAVRFHQMIVRDVVDHGMAQPMPVVIGSHHWHEYANAVYLPRKVAPRPVEPRPEPAPAPQVPLDDALKGLADSLKRLRDSKGGDRGLTLVTAAVLGLGALSKLRK